MHVITQYHLQLFFPAKKLHSALRDEHVRFLPGMGPFQYGACGMLDVNTQIDSWRRARTRDDIVGYMLSCLDRGVYLHVYGDDFFVPGTHSFRRRHRRHSTLVTGYDTSTNTFINNCYRSDASFRCGSIAFDALVESLDLNRHGCFDAVTPHSFDELTYTGHCHVRFDGTHVLQQLAEYITGVKNIAKYRLGGAFAVPNCDAICLADTDGAYGYDVYDAFQEYFRTTPVAPHRLDLRAIRVLIEHKQAIFSALGAVCAGHSECRRYLQSYSRDVLAIVKQLGWLAYRFDRMPEAGLLAHMDDMVAQLRECERPIIEALLSLSLGV